MKLTSEGHTLAIRAVLAAARLDLRSYALVMRDARAADVNLAEELIAVAVNFATALDALGYLEKIDEPGHDRRGREGAVEVIEDWLRGELDRRNGQAH